MKNLAIRILPAVGPTVVHIAPDAENQLQSFACTVSSFIHQSGDPLELREIALLLRRHEAEPFEERNDAVCDVIEAIDLEVPHPVSSRPHRAATEAPLEFAKDPLFTL